MSFIKVLWQSSVSPSATAKKVIKDVAKDFVKRWYNANIKGEDPPLYKSQISAIAYGYRTNFDEINNGVDVTI